LKGTNLPKETKIGIESLPRAHLIVNGTVTITGELVILIFKCGRFV